MSSTFLYRQDVGTDSSAFKWTAAAGGVVGGAQASVSRWPKKLCNNRRPQRTRAVKGLRPGPGERRDFSDSSFWRKILLVKYLSNDLDNIRFFDNISPLYPLSIYFEHKVNS
jgi:hypothetical protein